MKQSIIIILSLTLSLLAQSQQCISKEYNLLLNDEYPQMERAIQNVESFTADYITNNNNLKTQGTVITIPVVFHIVYHVEAQNIPDERIYEQLERLNLDYRRLNSDTVNTPEPFKSIAADCEIGFCLAQRDPLGNPTNGIIRVETDIIEWDLPNSDDVKFTADGGDDAWPANQYLNIWICNLGMGVLGYATPPGAPADLDGVVLSYQYVGNFLDMPPYDLGRTATHQIGHWLNLLHLGASSDCTVDDLVPDTPLESEMIVSCPEFPVMDFCSPDYPGIMFMNYMELGEDACLNLFTEGQKFRMQSLFEAGGFRYPLTYSEGCNSAVNIQTIEQINTLTIQPNPAHDILELSLISNTKEPAQIMIYDLTGGAIVMKELFVAVGSIHINLNIQSLPTGPYYLFVNSIDFKMSLPFVKE